MSNINIKQLADSYADLSSQYQSVLNSITEDQLNMALSDDSWTAAQVVNHIIKANDSGFLLAPGNVVSRDIGLQIPELKSTFLDFETKMQSPDFIIPDNRSFTKQESLESIKMTFENLIQNLPNNDLSLEIDTPLGKITKWELANFIVFHSQRHLHQLQKIQKSL